MVRAAMLSFWHFHSKGYTEQALEHPDIDLVAAWDEDLERGRARAGEYQIPFTDDLDELLGRPDIDGVIVQAPTSLHHDIIIKAAEAGKHVFSDKVLAPTIKEANEIVAAVDAARVVLFVGLSFLYHDYVAGVRAALKAGKIGPLVSLRITNCHGMAVEGGLPPGFFKAEEACGGALIDMCHAVYLVPYLLGKLPNSVYARLGHITGREVEDNAVAIFNYAGGAHAVVEASMVMGGAPRFLLEVHGTHGTVMFRSDSSPKGRGATVDSSFVVREGSGGGFVPAELGRPLPSPLSQWVDHIREGKRADENLSASLDLSRLIEAAYLSAGEGRAVALCDLDEGSVQS